MLVRFVGRDVHARSRQPIGIFTLAARVKRSGALPAESYDELQSHLAWFEEHLPAPTRLSPYRDGWRRGYRDEPKREPVAICWFKPAAKEHIARCWQIARILEAHGVAVELVRTKKPGYVTYEDELQVVAMPFGGDDG